MSFVKRFKRKAIKRSSSRRPVRRRKTSVRAVRGKRRVSFGRTHQAQAAKGYSSSVPAAIGSLAGGLAGGPGGAALGRALGSGAGALLNYISGHGDYKITSNSLIGAGTMALDALPKFTTENAGVRVVHREYINDIISSGTNGGFQQQKFPIQPGLSFPWLSTIAEQFQQYRINGMVFEFKTTSSDALNNINTALGEVIMTTQYNCIQADPLAPQQMYQNEFTSTCKPSETVLHAIECSRGQSPFVVLDVRNGSPLLLSAADIRLYDFANFYIATNGMQGSSVNIGQLWVSYDVTLLKPFFGPTTDVGDHWYNLTGYAFSPDTAFGSGNPGFMSLTPYSDLGSKLTFSGSTTQNMQITIPPSYFGIVNIQMIWNTASSSTGSYSTTGGDVSFTPFGNITPLRLMGNLGAQGTGLVQAVADNTGVYEYLWTSQFSCGGGDMRIQFVWPGASNLPFIATFDILITSWPSTLIA